MRYFAIFLALIVLLPIISYGSNRILNNVLINDRTFKEDLNEAASSTYGEDMNEYWFEWQNVPHAVGSYYDFANNEIYLRIDYVDSIGYQFTDTFGVVASNVTDLAEFLLLPLNFVWNFIKNFLPFDT